ncbi:MAG: hypothetical protein BroJett018_32470 [Chloroflexota bacterium]|nr:hypothetical protein [Chloroflexota bacterium]NOG62352.1 hypothetical protein [Chloroflexota bacterium]GIK65453.1 MAG: hypothetical protein BroJett018_32470 [Chloroflexota bacterium]
MKTLDDHQLAITVDDVFGQLVTALQTTPDDAAYNTGIAALEELQTRIFQALDDAKDIILAVVEQRNEAVATATAALDRQAELEDELSDVSVNLTTLTEALEHWYLTTDERVRDLVEEISEQTTEEAEVYALEYAFEVTSDNLTNAVRTITGCSGIEAMQVAALINDEFEGPVNTRTLELLQQVVAHLEKSVVDDAEAS